MIQKTEAQPHLGRSISLSDLHLGYGGRDVIAGLSLEVRAGEFIALLGQSGCGKTTILRALAGFVPVRAGRISVGGTDMSRTPPEARGMAMMFQSYALWPHMSVAQNIAYGLKLRRRPRAEIRARVAEMAALVGLGDLTARKVQDLSGGQRQRVALARALAIDPPVLLLDEPLSNLDAGIRATMRHEIRALQQRLGLTTILVTHDREEAMSMADRVVILEQGRIAQAGTPEEIYHQPASPYVARFMGLGNRLEARVEQGLLRTGNGTLPTGGLHAPQGTPEGPAEILFRAESARLGPAPGPALALSGQVVSAFYLGSAYRHEIAVGDDRILVDAPQRHQAGTPVGLHVPATALSLFPARSQTSVTGQEAAMAAIPTL
ncbi:ABC transporter ATP-binding protein [Pseudooceanicola sp. CBS1P-1]|uniref:ATP-binding cassette domain-containing protein n=1 Tax=Pseudooceanicola albus TaxID=2692189 RepID=A0A6L7GAL2_9RHOB|nr:MULTISPECIES: ABC transporter ATP-binding protein [Pseudooceanicola]MBT9386291.1 ABC transporter ATP-binding protein [Pseudooceanicola endophyticus]MXN20340.1 ATP-binding cassette domain-containing protein [Pseudooceanicola albus]